MEIPIIYEDDYLIAIDKPFGVVVNNSENVRQQTIQDWATRKLGLGRKGEKDSSYFFQRAGIVHRLDKETSGILLIAKSEQTFNYLQKQFKERQVKKTYLALVEGRLESRSQVIKLPIGRMTSNRRKFGVVAGGRTAVTKVEIIGVYESGAGEKFTLVEAKPETGRTHQIRVHLKFIGHNVVSDRLYSGRKIYRSRLLFCPRLFLHAHRLVFFHPVSKKRKEIVSRLPGELEKVLKSLHKLI